MPPSTLQLVEIYFDTATFDDIDRDEKIKTEAHGGTMGLLTGFSIISGVEIVFFLIRSHSMLVFKLNLLFLGCSVPSESKEERFSPQRGANCKTMFVPKRQNSKTNVVDISFFAHLHTLVFMYIFQDDVHIRSKLVWQTFI